MEKMIEKEIEKWLKSSDVTEEMKKEINEMTEDDKSDAFGKSLSFGTAGMRGKLQPGTNRMNVFTVLRATIGFKYYLNSISNGKKQTIVIAHDNRKNSKLFSDLTAKNLADGGINVIVFDSLRPTPLLSYAIRYYKADGGIVITASHNPKEYNGYKIYDETGCQITENAANKITEYINNNPFLPPFSDLKVDDKGKIEIATKEIEDDFIYDCKSCQINRSEKKELSIVFTPQHGTGQVFGPRLLSECGYKVYPVKEQMSDDPEFSNTKCANPEKYEAYELALNLAKSVNSDVIFSTDPDADRIGVMYKDNENEYHLLTGNEIGILLIDYLLSEKKKKSSLPKNGGVIFQSIVTNSLGIKIAQKYNVNVECFLTGFKYIGEAVTRQESIDKNSFIMGYEESCGYLVNDFCRDKDAFEAMVVIAEMANHHKLNKKNLGEVLEDIYNEFGYTININREINFVNLDASVVSKKMQAIRENMPDSICGKKINKIEDYLSLNSYDKTTGKVSKLNVPSENVLKLFLEDDRHWIAVRPSGTEPKVKFYYECSGKSKKEALDLAEKFDKEIKNLFNNN